MRVALRSPYVDARAADLRHALGEAPRPALETLALVLGPYALELRLLGHSHQALVRGAGGLRFAETVACADGGGPDAPVPARLEADTPGGHRYVFRAATTPLDAAARRLADDIARDRAGLVGVFPGDAGEPDAFTALRARRTADGVRWETWHAYPQTGELVHTVGALRAC